MSNEETANGNKMIPEVNGHIHSPHSFSAFSNMEQPFRMAREEGISVLGINDFYTTGGYPEFAETALRYRIFPLFNIEFMALQKEEQRSGIRINDPVNPGRTYLSGKGLRYPVSMNDRNAGKLAALQRESNSQTYRMVEKLNGFLSHTSTGLKFDAARMQQQLAKDLLRERHIATAIRSAVFNKFRTESGIRKCLTEIFSGNEPVSSLSDISALENEIRNNLLKSGGAAYVEEDEKAFLALEEVTALITDAGGIPCYPVLLDDPKGYFTEFEKDRGKMAGLLSEKGIYMIELIPGRNDFQILKDFVRFFHSRGFIITFGTEHNTPRLDPLTVTCRGGIALDYELKRINYRGASVIAAHQYLTTKGEEGFPHGHFPSTGELQILEKVGNKFIRQFINQ